MDLSLTHIYLTNWNLHPYTCLASGFTTLSKDDGLFVHFFPNPKQVVMNL